MSNNFDGPILLDDGLTASSYLGFGRNAAGDASTGCRLYAAANLATINGILTAPRGSLAMLLDGPTARNTDGGTTWELIATGGGGSFEYDEVTVLSAASADLEAEPTRNIAYEGSNLAINQALPTPGTRKLYRFMCAGTGESSVTFSYAGAGGIVGLTQAFGTPSFGGLTFIYGTAADAWYAFPGGVGAP